jgi:hypothetical protein
MTGQFAKQKLFVRALAADTHIARGTAAYRHRFARKCRKWAVEIDPKIFAVAAKNFDRVI